MVHPLDYILDTMSNVEKEDLRISVLLIHPDDVKDLEANSNFFKYASSSARPEWVGDLIGEIWNAKVIVTSQVERRLPDALPQPGGCRSLVSELTFERSRPRAQLLPSKKLSRLQMALLHVRNWSTRKLGGTLPGKFNGPKV